MTYKKNIILDYFITFFKSFNVTQGIWLVYLYNRGFSIFEIALFEGVFHVTGLLMEIPTGAIADLFGRKTSRILSIFSYFIYIAVLLNSDNFAIVAIGFVFGSLSYVFDSGAAEALVYDSLIEDGIEDQYLKISGKKEVIFQVSGFLALLVGGTIASINPDYNFYITGVFFIISLFIIFMMKEVEIKREEKPTLLNQLSNQFVISTQTVFKNKRLLLLIIIGALMTAPITTIFFFLQNYFDLNGTPIQYMTIILGLHAGAGAIGGYFAHTLEKKYGEKKILYLVPLFMSISFWLILIEPIMIIPFIFLGFLDAIFYLVLIDYINKMVTSDKRATVLSFFGMTFSVVMIVVFSLIGYIIEYVSFEVAYVVLAGIVTLFYIVLVVAIKGNHLQKIE